MSRAAAAHAAGGLRACIRATGVARIIAATGASQIEFLEALTSAPDIDWSHVEMFHLDEYVGLPISHPASFRRYLLDRLINKVGVGRYHLLDGEGDPVRQILKSQEIIAVVPDPRKAAAVKACVEGPVTPHGARVGSADAHEHDAVPGRRFSRIVGAMSTSTQRRRDLFVERTLYVSA